MICALTVRKLKPGSFEQFEASFTPPGEELPTGMTRFHLLRDGADPDRVVTFGFFDGTREEFERRQEEFGYAEMRAAVDPLVEAVEVNGVFDVLKEMTAETAGTTR